MFPHFASTGSGSAQSASPPAKEFK